MEELLDKINHCFYEKSYLKGICYALLSVSNELKEIKELLKSNLFLKTIGSEQNDDKVLEKPFEISDEFVENPKQLKFKFTF